LTAVVFMFAAAMAGSASAHPGQCVETTNPHGMNVPPAGLTTSPGTNPNSGQNDDGFYLLSSTDVNAMIFVRDSGSGMVFGPYPNPVKIKYTEANGATPSAKKIGSTMGQAGAVFVHITGTGDAQVFTSANATLTACVVPPPPR